MPFPRLVKPGSARRDELLDAAQTLFARHGYEATSVNQIIAEIGVSKGAFYHHFKAKEDLIEALACRYAEQSAARAVATISDPTLDGYARLSVFLAQMRHHKSDTAMQLRWTFEPLLRAENAQLFERTHRAIANVIRPHLVRIISEGVAEQSFDTPDPGHAADVILHLMSSHRDLAAAIYAARSPEEFELLSERLLHKIAFLGTVIDRILGLPEGSIELADREMFCVLAASIKGADSAA